MADIVERLREWATHYNRSGVSDHFKEAADEIERLREVNRQFWYGDYAKLEKQNAELLAALQEIADLRYSNTSAATIARVTIEKAK